MTIDWFTFVAQIINFLILIWLLQRFLYAPVMRAMADRESQIAQQFADAEAAQARADASLQDCERQHQELAQARDTMLARAASDVEAWKDEQLRQARSDVDEGRRLWLEDLTREKHLLLRELQLDVTQHAVELGRRILAQLADQSLQSRLVDRFLEQLQDSDLSALRTADTGAQVIVASSHELTTDDRERVSGALADVCSAVEFQTRPHLLCGIELQAPGCRLSWNLRDTLAEVESDLIDAVEESLPGDISERAAEVTSS